MKAVINLLVGLTAAAACAFVSMKMNAPVENEVQVKPDEKTTKQRARPAETEEETSAELPIAVRPKASTPEGIFRIVSSFRQREDSLRAREQTLDDRENRLKLVMRDIRTEQAAIDGLKAQVEERVQAAEELLSQLANQREEWQHAQTRQQTEMKKFEKAKKEVDASEARNIKKWSEILKGVEPTKAAETLREMANDGKMELAVQLLANLEARDASKIIAEVNDTSLVVQFTDEFRRLKTANAQPKGKGARR